jgi:hypothetical protein
MPGKNNWVKLTYEGLPKRKLGESFTIEYTETTDRNISFRQACLESAQEIYETYNKNIYVSMGGGADSECVGNSFYDQGLPFTPVIVKVENYNYHDIRFALDWCQQRNLTPLIIEHSVEEWGDILIDYFIKAKNRMISSGGLMYVADKIKNLGGYLVTGCCDLQLLPDPGLSFCYPLLCSDYVGQFTQWESDYALDQWDPGYHPNGFFIWKPEMLTSFVQERKPDWGNEEAKWYVYNVPPRPKFTGGEYYMPIICKKNEKLIANGMKLFGKHDWVIAGSKESILTDLYRNK